MKQATISLQFPKTAQDASVLLVKQMIVGITLGDVEGATAEARDGLSKWLDTAKRITDNL